MKTTRIHSRSRWRDCRCVWFPICYTCSRTRQFPACRCTVPDASSCQAFLPLVVKPMMTIQDISQKIIFDSPKTKKPSFTRGTLPWRWRIHFSNTSECSHVSTSVQVLSPIGIVLVDELADSRPCGFATAFDRLVKSLALNLNAFSSNCTSEVSTNLLTSCEILTSENCLCL